MVEKVERRTFLCALSIGVFIPSAAFSQDLACTRRLDVAYLLPLTGPFADTGLSIWAGANEAAKELDCTTNLLAYDTEASIERLFRGVDEVVNMGNARIIVGPFSSGIAEKFASSYSDLLFLNLSQRPDNIGVDIPNYVSLPISAVEEGIGSSEDPYYWQGYLALELLVAAARVDQSGFGSFINYLKSERLQTARGEFFFSYDSGAFLMTN